MSAHFLHNLEDLPRSARICVLGEKGRNSRFMRLLRECRPDLAPPLAVDFPGSPSPAIPLPDMPSTPSLLPKEALSAHDLILITSAKPKPVSAWLDALGLRGYRIVNPNFSHPFLQPGAQAHLPMLAEARELLEREPDRRYYDLVLSTLGQRNDLRDLYFKLTEIYGRMGRQYFDFILPSEIRTVIEGGVEEGRNTVQFLGSFPGAAIHGFDPDGTALQRGYFQNYLENHPGVHLSPLALWSRNGRLSFRGGKEGRSTVSLSREETSAEARMVEAVSLDQFVQANGIAKVDFIKMDIEGSELEALKGATAVLRDHRPQLAVCMYHRLEHYYEIPKFLSQYAEDYLFRVGHYSARYLFSETVLYGIPREIQSKCLDL